MKKWRPIDWDGCDLCGDSAEIYTDADDGYAYDGDPARCVSCGAVGHVSADEDTPVWINWYCGDGGEIAACETRAARLREEARDGDA